MPKRVEILDKRTVFDRFFKVIEMRLRHETQRGGMSDVLTRLVIDRGDSAAVLIHNRERDTLLFTEQFRAPTYEKGPGWLLEIPAGSVEEGESPDKTMLRELEEEMGYVANKLEPISTFYVSPGGLSERIFLYYGVVTTRDQKYQNTGVASEGEDIKTVEIKTAEAFRKLDAGEFADAKTIIALQWFRLKERDLNRKAAESQRKNREVED